MQVVFDIKAHHNDDEPDAAQVWEDYCLLRTTLDAVPRAGERVILSLPTDQDEFDGVGAIWVVLGITWVIGDDYAPYCNVRLSEVEDDEADPEWKGAAVTQYLLHRQRNEDPELGWTRIEGDDD